MKGGDRLRRSAMFRVALWIGLLLLASPGLAAAQNAVLYEVSEKLKIELRSPWDRHRMATATLVGLIDAGSSICPTWLVQKLRINKCGLTATASDDIFLDTGRGRGSGDFQGVI